MAERRQLTVIFCDLVGSTSLARMGPEDLRERRWRFRYWDHLAAVDAIDHFLNSFSPSARQRLSLEPYRNSSRSALGLARALNTFSHNDHSKSMRKINNVPTSEI